VGEENGIITSARLSGGCNPVINVAGITRRSVLEPRKRPERHTKIYAREIIIDDREDVERARGNLRESDPSERAETNIPTVLSGQYRLFSRRYTVYTVYA